MINLNLSQMTMAGLITESGALVQQLVVKEHGLEAGCA